MNSFLSTNTFLDKIIKSFHMYQWHQFVVVPKWYGGPNRDTFRFFHKYHENISRSDVAWAVMGQFWENGVPF